LAGIGLCPVDDGFPASTEAKRPRRADCEVPADIWDSADSRAWAFAVGTNVIGLNANSLVLALSPGILPFVGEAELACTDLQFLSDPTAVAGRRRQLVDRNNWRDRGQDMATTIGTIGNDNLVGGRGDDVLLGGAGSARLNGGSGAVDLNRQHSRIVLYRPVAVRQCATVRADGPAVGARLAVRHSSPPIA
jgi:hypothetical protein